MIFANFPEQNQYINEAEKEGWSVKQMMSVKSCRIKSLLLRGKAERRYDKSSSEFARLFVRIPFFQLRKQA